MATPSKPLRKTISFDGGDRDDLALLDAIKEELQRKYYASFGELCKVALHQFLLGREPTHAVILFMELERQIATLQNKVAWLEQTGSSPTLERLDALEARLASLEIAPSQATNTAIAPENNSTNHLANHSAASVDKTAPESESVVDPLLARLAPLLEDF